MKDNPFKFTLEFLLGGERMTSSIKVLVEDTGSEHLALGTEHGLSLYVETPKSAFVFDCGATGLAWRNAALMHADLAKVQFAVISHSHYDHAGGFPALREFAAPKKLYIGKGFWNEKFGYAVEGSKYTYLGAGFGQDDPCMSGISVHEVDKTVRLDDYAWLMGQFPRNEVMETIPERFVCGEDKHRDDFEDEICLVLREGEGVAVITGCSHPGILNIVTEVHRCLGLPVTSVVGGTHLKEANAERIDKTLEVLRSMGLKRMALCHCSGTEVRDRLAEDSAAGCLLSTGDLLEF